jgi:hypothetical protein
MRALRNLLFTRLYKPFTKVCSDDFFHAGKKITLNIVLKRIEIIAGIRSPEYILLAVSRQAVLCRQKDPVAILNFESFKD